MKHEFETDRLVARITSAQDQQALIDCINDPQIAQMVYIHPQPFTQKHAKAWCDRANKGAKEESEWLFSVFEKDSGSYIGSINLEHYDAKARKVEIGYWLAAPFRGKGYAREILSGALSFAQEGTKIDMIYATTATFNPRSSELLIRAGFEKVEEISCRKPDGSDRPSLYFEKIIR